MYKGKSLSTTFDSQFFTEENAGQPVNKLKQWYGRTKAEGAKLLSEPTEQRGEREDRSVLIAEVEERCEQELYEKDAAFFWVDAKVTYIKQTENTAYHVCPNCGKKIHQESESEFRCEHCSTVTDKPNLAFMLTMKIEDSSGGLFVKVFAGQAPKIMGDTTPQQYLIAKQASEHDDKEIKDLLASKYYKPFRMMLIGKKDNRGQVERIEYTAGRVLPHSRTAESGAILKRLAAYKEQEAVMQD